MDLQSTLTGLPQLPAEMNTILSAVSQYLPQQLIDSVSSLRNTLPAEIDLALTSKFLLFFVAASLILGVMGRVCLGKRSSLNRSLSSAIGILAIYALSVILYTYKPWSLDTLVSPLPFVRFAGEYLIVIPFQGTAFTTLCSEILSLIILAFLVNLLDTFMPQGGSALGWYFLRFATVVLGLLLQLMANYAFQTYLPGVLVTYAPAILLVLLGVMLLMGLLNLILSVVLTAVNPIFGAMYAFFFGNAVGKQLSKAIFTTGIICCVFFLLGYFGFTVISITAASLMTYIPLALVLLILWFLIGHLL